MVWFHIFPSNVRQTPGSLQINYLHEASTSGGVECLSSFVLIGSAPVHWWLKWYGSRHLLILAVMDICRLIAIVRKDANHMSSWIGFAKPSTHQQAQIRVLSLALAFLNSNFCLKHFVALWVVSAWDYTIKPPSLSKSSEIPKGKMLVTVNVRTYNKNLQSKNHEQRV